MKGDDLLDYFRGAKPWRRLRAIVDALPRMGSHYADALAQDDEVAQRMLEERQAYDERGEDPPARVWRPRVSEWSMGEELAAALYDRMGEVGTIIGNRGRKSRAKPPKRYPRPETALDRAEAAALVAYTESLEADYEAAVARYDAYRAGEVGPLLSGDRA